MSYSDMKNFYPIQIIDLIFQVHRKNHKNIHLFEETSVDLGDARLFFRIFSSSELQKVSDGIEISEYEVV